MRRDTISTSQAPQAIGPYSQAISTDALIFVSGQIPIDPASGQLVAGGIREQTHRVLQNLAAILKAANTSLEKTVKTTVYLKDMNHFQEMNQVYGEYFKENPPARATVEVARLPKDVLVEIDLIALK
ncbi:MAG TPA: RidA family protein [Acidobacteriota bacterium]|nr:RidA family protein [Acidobacteriota bacterium]